MENKTIALIIVIAAVLYIMFHHNSVLAASGPSNSPTYGLGNPLGVGSGSGGRGGGGTTLGGIAHNYANDPATCLTCAGAGAPSGGAGAGVPSAPHNNLRLVGEVPYTPPIYKPPTTIASQAPSTPSGLDPKIAAFINQSPPAATQLASGVNPAQALLTRVFGGK